MTTSAAAPADVIEATPGSENAPRTTGHGWLSQHVGTAIIGGFLGYILGHWFGNYLGSAYPYIANSGQNSLAVLLALLFMVVGWLLGIGALNYPLLKIVGREAQPEVEHVGWSKYFRYNLDHKVVGLQYVVGVLMFFFTGGLLAMAIRTELLSPTVHVFSADTYIKIVSEHGTIMMMMASSVVVGPLGNYFVPLMIGARRMAFPRIEAFSLWTFVAGYLVIFSALFFGGFPTGWTGYAPLQTQAGPGMVSYLFGFAVISVGMMLAGFNLAVTIINYRAPGMTWSRVPVFVWGIIATAALLTLASPVLLAAGLFGLLDKTAQTAFYVTEHGGSSYLWENLFWFFGHPEVYIMALPGFGIVGEIIPVFTRKPLFAYRVAAAGMIGVALLSFFVWQHHLFQSGIDPDMRPLFMLTTELISIPTGFIFLVGLGTMYRAKIRWEVPMLFCMSMYFNLTFFPMFIIGLLGQPRRPFTYARDLQTLNDFSSIAAFCLGASFLIFVANLMWSQFIAPQKAPANPWDSLGLEWQTATPIPVYNFERIPVIMTDPYHYSEVGAPALADFGDGSPAHASSSVVSSTDPDQ